MEIKLRRASMEQTMSPSICRRFWAMASSVDTPQQGLSAAQASPFRADTPIRRPVKLPGPAATASRSMSDSDCSLSRSMASTSGIRVRLWVSPVF